MSKAKDSSEVPTPLISLGVVQELASESTDSYAEVPIRNLKSDRDRSRTLRRARKRLRAARRMESRTEKERVERHKTVPENCSKLLY